MRCNHEQNLVIFENGQSLSRLNILKTKEYFSLLQRLTHLLGFTVIRRGRPDLILERPIECTD